jgi:glucose/arabinose dehydrogenase
MFPAEYKNSALVSLHGSWNREKPSGYKLIWIRYENGKPISQEDFITGFLTDGNKEIIGRPVGLLELKDGSVLVSDDENGNIYRITYGI